MLNTFLNIFLLTVNLLFYITSLYSSISLFNVALVIGALIWLISLYFLLKYNHFFLLAILFIFLLILSVPQFLLFMMTYAFNGMTTSSPLFETTLISVSGMIYCFFNPLLSIIIICRKQTDNILKEAM